MDALVQFRGRRAVPRAADSRLSDETEHAARERRAARLGSAGITRGSAAKAKSLTTAGDVALRENCLPARLEELGVREDGQAGRATGLVALGDADRVEVGLDDALAVGEMEKEGRTSEFEMVC